jgi:hypothetical protein
MRDSIDGQRLGQGIAIFGDAFNVKGQGFDGHLPSLFQRAPRCHTAGEIGKAHSEI